jgi:hypothetical protein
MKKSSSKSPTVSAASRRTSIAEPITNSASRTAS